MTPKRMTMPRNSRSGRNDGFGTAPALAALLALVLAGANRSADASPAATPPAAAAPASAPPASGPVEVVDTDPGQLIDSAAKAMLNDLDAHRAEYRKDPAKINALVDRVLLPHFDTDYSARLVLGKHWNSASPEQRQRFVSSFYHSLLANYGTALLDFTGDRQFSRQLLASRKQLPGETRDRGLRYRFRRDDQVIDADRLDLVVGPRRR